MTNKTDEGYLAQGERDDVTRNKQTARDLRIAECESADFNVGRRGVARLAESIAAASEIATVEQGFRRKVSDAPLIEVDDSRYTPDKSTNISRLHALVIVGDKLFAVGSTQIRDGIRLGLKDVGYGEANDEYSDQPGAVLLGDVDVSPRSTGEDIDPENAAEIKAGGLLVQYRDGQIFVGSDPDQPNDSPVILIDNNAGISESDKLVAKNGYEALQKKLAFCGSLWKP